MSAAVKAAPKLQDGKWDAKTQLGQPDKVHQALVTVRKTYQARVSKTSEDMEEAKFSSDGKPILTIGMCAPNWAHLPAKGAFTLVWGRCYSNKNKLGVGIGSTSSARTE